MWQHDLFSPFPAPGRNIKIFTDAKYIAMNKTRQFTIGGFLVKPSICRMYGHGKEIPLGQRQMKLLVFLASRSGEVVRKTELLEHVWEDVIVSDDAVRKSVSDLRILFKNGKESIEIESIRGIGYRLLTPVNKAGANKKVAPLKYWPVGAAATFLLLVIFQVFIKDEKGGDLALSLHNLPIVRSPRVSADNTKLVYASSHNGESRLYLYDKNDKRHELIERSGMTRAEAAISPDGKKIAYVARQNGVKYLFQKDLKTGRKNILTKLNGTPIQSFIDWSPDGKNIAYANAPDNCEYHIYFINPRTKQTLQKTTAGKNNSSSIYPRFSPSGKKMSYIKIKGSSNLYNQFIQGTGSLFIKDLNESNEQQITYRETEICGHEWISENEIAFIKNTGSEFVLLIKNLSTHHTDTLYRSVQLLRHLEFRDNKLWLEKWDVPYKLMQRKKGTEAKIIFEKTNRFWHPALSPTRDKVAFAGLGNEGFDIKIRDLTVGEETTIVKSQVPLLHPKWSKDEQHILYTKHLDTAGQLFLYNFKTGRNAHKANGYFPCWDKKGEYFYFTYRGNESWEAFKQVRQQNSKPEKINGLHAFRIIPYQQKFLFVKHEAKGIWLFDPKTKTEKLLVDDHVWKDATQWKLVNDQIIYWSRNERGTPSLKKYDLTNGKKEYLFTHNGFINYAYAGIDWDERSEALIYPVQDYFENEIVQVAVK